MSVQSPLLVSDEIEYPQSDGQPRSDNTLQFQWITMIVGNLQALFHDNPKVFVAGDLLWYPIEGDNKTRTAPDAMVEFNRPKGHRGSYMPWKEGGIPPQVVFEVLSPGNRVREMTNKFRFYERFGVEEYYLHDPDQNELSGWSRDGSGLDPVAEMDGWLSPRLGSRFEYGETEIRILGPDGRSFATFEELSERAQREEARAASVAARADQEAARGEAHRAAPCLGNRAGRLNVGK
ncbi:MAG: Uma2 family endonuclease [Isosphaeraceae bacterium]|nr:Uma2 family endonuclease [Isosphaeraceae bacterium]